LVQLFGISNLADDVRGRVRGDGVVGAVRHHVVRRPDYFVARGIGGEASVAAQCLDGEL
jgi:hypothetical protein